MNFLRWLLWGPVRWGLARLPQRRVLTIGRLVGRLSTRVMGGRRRILAGEYARMFPEKSEAEVRGIVRDAFVLRSMTELEYLLHGQLTRARCIAAMDVDGLPRLDASLRRGRGVMLIIFHFGAHLQIMPALGFRGYPIHQVANQWTPAIDRAAGNPLSRFWAERVHRLRVKHSAANWPVKMIFVAPGSSPRPLFDCLKQNGILIVALDGRDVGQLVQVPFFHHAAYAFAAGPMDLALRTRAAVHPVFIVRDAAGKNTLVIEDEVPLADAEAADKQARIVAQTAQVVAVLERYVRRYPSHYGMEILFEFHRLHAPPVTAPDGR